jgi:hypothetical protein
VDNHSALTRFVEASLTHDVRDRIGAVEAPALILHAGKDALPPSATRASSRR